MATVDSYTVERDYCPLSFLFCGPNSTSKENWNIYIDLSSVTHTHTHTPIVRANKGLAAAQYEREGGGGALVGKETWCDQQGAAPRAEARG